MKKQSKILGIVMIMFLVITMVSALEIMKPASLNENYTLIQTCGSCTYLNFTISNVNGIQLSNKGMIDNGSGNWVYYYTPTVTSRHDVTGRGDINGVDTSFATYFEVTPSGKVATTGDSILYALFSVILFGLLSLMSFFVISIPNENIKDDQGFETQVVRIKYFRIVLISLMYPILMLLLNFLNGLAVNYSALSYFSGILGFLFEIMVRLAWLFTVLMIVWIVYYLIHDTNLKRQLNKFDNFNPFK